MKTARRLSGSLYVLSLVVTVASVSMALVTGCPATPPTDGNGNTNDNTNTNDNGTTERTFAGAATCSACHSDKHGDWSATAHATALDTLDAIGQAGNAECLPCHTVGFEDGGFISAEETPEFAGVQCENCHGSGLEHASNPSDESLRPTVNLASTVCGQCHTDAHHPTFDEWQLSKHGNALAGLRTSSHAGDSCLECHSQDYRYAIEEGETPPTIDTAVLSLECSTCHSPHGGVAQDHQLRQPVADLCGECHTQEEATLGDSPHHPQFEMITGTGAFDADGAALEQSGPHTGLFASGGAACAQCHVVQHEVEEPDEGNPNVTGHTFNPFDEEITSHQADAYTGCLMCHGTAEAAEGKRTSVQADISGRLEALAVYFDSTNASYIDSTTLSEADQARLSAAAFNYSFVNADGSRGVHNVTYAEALLTIAEEIVADLSVQ